jgi:hypothetical protein
MSKVDKTNKNVSETGAASYQEAVEASRRLREIKFQAGHCYARAFLKYATTADTRPGKDAVFVTTQLPSRVFISELLGEQVYNPMDEENTSTGYKCDNKLSCYEITTKIGRDIARICENVTGDESNYEEAIKASEYKLEWVQSYIKKIQASLIASRPELAGEFGIKDYCGLARSNFDVIIAPVIKSMIKFFSNTRTDILTWVAKSQTTNIGERFSVGSIKPAEEDDGEMLNTCFKIAALSEEISLHNFMLTDDGKIFPAVDMGNSNFRDAYNKWARAFKTGRIPWSRPTDNPIHFCIDVECTLDKARLTTDQTTGLAVYTFGYYRSSLGEGGKMNKILGAAKTGAANDDPDYIQVFMGYTSSEDAQTASRNMTVSDITIPGVRIFKPEQIEDAFNTIASDTYRRKVRLYDEFPLADRMNDFRKYINDNKVLDWLDTNTYEDALTLLGIQVEKTDADSLAANLYSAPTAPQESIPATPQAGTMEQMAAAAMATPTIPAATMEAPTIPTVDTIPTVPVAPVDIPPSIPETPAIPEL